VRAFDGYLSFGIDVLGLKLVDDLFERRARIRPPPHARGQINQLPWLRIVRARSDEKVKGDRRLSGSFIHRVQADFLARSDQAGGLFYELLLVHHRFERLHILRGGGRCQGLFGAQVARSHSLQ
jgi:hypothetical protein